MTPQSNPKSLRRHLPKVLLLTASVLGFVLIYDRVSDRRLLPLLDQIAVRPVPIVCPVDPTLHQRPPVALTPEQPISQLLPRSWDRNKVSLLIEKSHHRLTVFYDQKPLKSYDVVFGDPVGDKRREGDRKTPEGIFKIRDKYPHPDWSKFLWIDYPNAQSDCKHRQAKERNDIPLESAIGGEVGIHGVPTGRDHLVDERVNWTLGCPSLKTKDVDELYEVVQVGTIVEIVA